MLSPFFCPSHWSSMGLSKSASLASVQDTSVPWYEVSKIYELLKKTFIHIYTFINRLDFWCAILGVWT